MSKIGYINKKKRKPIRREKKRKKKTRSCRNEKRRKVAPGLKTGGW